MKLLQALSGIFCLAHSAHGMLKTNEDQFHGATKNYIGNTMWIFGEGGVYAYSADGKVKKNHVNSEAICHSKEDFTGPSYMYCRFNDIVSDGKKYVWAALSGSSLVYVFDINSASMVGKFDTCENPRNVEYHPLRDEVWIRCSDVVQNSTVQTNLDVISAVNPSGDIQTDILMKDRALSEGLTSRGYSVIDNTLGDVGYLTDSELPELFKVDLSTKEIIEKVELSPASHALYKTAYSPMNRHIFIRAQMCCTCGFDGADLGTSCGRSEGYPVSPTTGLFAGQTDVNGVCGSSCEAKTGIDTVGVYEYDTVTDSVVTTHVMKEGFGGDPYPSPDGKYIVLLGRNGGKTIRILEAGTQGLRSRTLMDLELDFSTEGYENTSVSKDFAFVYKNGKTKVVFPSGTEHKVAIVEIPETGDIRDGDVQINYVTFNTDEFIQGRAPHGRYRRIEWAVGTDYVWVNDGSLEELYVIDVEKMEVATVLTEVDSGDLVSVQNFDRSRQFEEQKQMFDVMAAEQSKMVDGMADMAVKDSNTMEITAIIIGVLAIVVGAMNFAFMAKMRNEFKGGLTKDEPRDLLTKRADVESDGATPSVDGLNSIN